MIWRWYGFSSQMGPIQTKPIRSRACQRLIMQNGTRVPRPFFRLSTPPKQARAPPAKWKARNSEDNRQQLRPIWNRMIEHIRTFMIWDAPTRDRSGSRSEEHTSELQSLMRISYAVF